MTLAEGTPALLVGRFQSRLLHCGHAFGSFGLRGYHLWWHRVHLSVRILTSVGTPYHKRGRLVYGLALPFRAEILC